MHHKMGWADFLKVSGSKFQKRVSETSKKPVTQNLSETNGFFPLNVRFTSNSPTLWVPGSKKNHSVRLLSCNHIIRCPKHRVIVNKHMKYRFHKNQRCLKIKSNQLLYVWFLKIVSVWMPHWHIRAREDRAKARPPSFFRMGMVSQAIQPTRLPVQQQLCRMITTKEQS